MTIIDGDKLADSMHYKLCNDVACLECSFLLKDGKCKVEKWLDEAPIATGLHEECYELPNGADITFQYDDNGMGMVTLTVMDMLVDMANKKPNRGEWKPFDFTFGRGVYQCTSCYETVEVTIFMGKPIYKHCPWCGARMKGADDE